MESLLQKIRKHSINSGLLLGLAVFILGVFSFYLSTSSTISSTWVILCVRLLFGVLIPIALLVVFCFGVRKKVGGYWNYKQAATGIFILLFTAFATFFVAQNIIFAKLIEPDLAQKNEAAAIKLNDELLKKSSASQATIEAREIEFKKQLVNPPLIKIIERIWGAILMMLVLALIAGAIFKRKPPLQDEYAGG